MNDWDQGDRIPQHNAIDVERLVKRFGGLAAVDGLDLTVRTGEVHGFLGPNGAGGSTTIRILLGLCSKGNRQKVIMAADEASRCRALCQEQVGDGAAIRRA